MTLSSGAAPALKGTKEVTRTLGDGVHDRQGGAGELIGEIRSTTPRTHSFDDVDKVDEFESDLIGLEAFAIEGHGTPSVWK